jgi:formylglycine-generating enzyme required for sulfatase activity
MGGTLLLLAALLVAGACAAGDKQVPGGELIQRAVFIPAGMYAVGSREPGCYPPAEVTLEAFYFWPTEVTRGWWRMFRPGDPAGEGEADAPVAAGYDDALAFCAWVSEHYGIRARLPTPQEWMAAASSGTAGVKYPWGWGEPEGRAAFDATSAVAVASFPPAPNGLYDMAGNLAEWAMAAAGEDRAPVMGGSWAERDPDYLRIAHRLNLPVTYRGADVGFRLLIECP